MADWPYNTGAWKRLRGAHLARSPLCEGCEAIGITRIANTVDHRVPISAGGPTFPGFDGLASYCPACHSAKTARGSEAGAVRSTKPRRGCDVHGSPLDPAHPWRGGDGGLSRDAIERRMPSDLKPSRIPIVIVTGPPGAGKSTYVRQRTQHGDLVICLDAIVQTLTGQPEHQRPSWAVPKALVARNTMLRALSSDHDHPRAFFIVSASDPAERRQWQSRLGGELVVLDTPLAECIRRIKADPARAGQHARMIDVATRWWAANPHLAAKSLRADARRPTPPQKIELVHQPAPEDEQGGR